MQYRRMPIEKESPEELGYSNILYNLAESSVRDLEWKDLDIKFDELVLCYGEHRGGSELRKKIVEGQTQLKYSDVLVTPSAAAALFMIHSALLEKESHLVVVRPNYATNLETPYAIGCAISFVDIVFEQGYDLCIEELKQAVMPSTKLMSITTPHNPTGRKIPIKDIYELANFCAARGIYLLVDETYIELQWDGTPPPPYAANINKYVISVSSLSKAYGVPGIRTGWIICKDEMLMEILLAAKEQILICNSVLDEAVALHVLSQEQKILKNTMQNLPEKFEILKNWVNSNAILEWVEPQGGVVAFPRITLDTKIDLQIFYRKLFTEYSTVVGPGHWFGLSDHYMRIGFGYPHPEELVKGLDNISICMEKSLLFHTL